MKRNRAFNVLIRFGTVILFLFFFQILFIYLHMRDVSDFFLWARDICLEAFITALMLKLILDQYE